jgi:hypothetical protein
MSNSPQILNSAKRYAEENAPSFVLSGLIDVANDAFKAAIVGEQKAASDLADARAALKIATLASERAVAGNGEDPMLAEEALEVARRAVVVREKVATAKNKAREQARAAIDDAKGIAAKPLQMAGIRGVLAALRKADEARAMMKAAHQAMRNAEAMVSHSRSVFGLSLGQFEHHLGRALEDDGRDLMPTEADERRFLLGNGFSAADLEIEG